MNLFQTGLLSAVAAPFGIALWVAFLHRRPAAPVGHAAADAGMRFGLTHPCFKAESHDLEPEVMAAVTSLADDARGRFVRVQFAVVPGSRVRVDWDVLGMSLRSFLRTAIDATQGGNVLVTARPVGTEMHIQIMDDGTDPDQRSRESLTRDAAALIALQGGSVAVEARRGRGTAVTIRLPLPRDLGSEELVAEPSLAAEVLG